MNIDNDNDNDEDEDDEDDEALNDLEDEFFGD